MRTQYLIIVLSIFSFSVLMAQQKEGKLLNKFEKETATKVERQVADIKTSANSPSSTADVNVVDYDFTVAGASYTTGADPMVQVDTDGNGDPVYGMIAGDANQDGQVDADDRAATWNSRNNTGYLGDDVTLDGQVDADDRAKTWNNRNLVSQVPL